MANPRAFIPRILTATALLLLCTPVSGQDGADSTEAGFRPDTGAAAAHYNKMSRRKATYSVDMAGYVGGGGGNTSWGFAANPQVSAPIGKKADITAGISVVQSYYNGADFIPWSTVNGGRPSRNFSTTDAIFYAAGSYYVNSRLTVHAAGFINLSGNGNPFAPQKGFSVGADYRFSDRAWISFNYTYMEGGLPYPYGYGYYGMPGGMGNFYRPSGGFYGPYNHSPFL